MGGYGIVGQVINVPVDVNNMVTTNDTTKAIGRRL
jgi:hypothetical protein